MAKCDRAQPSSPRMKSVAQEYATCVAEDVFCLIHVQCEEGLRTSFLEYWIIMLVERYGRSRTIGWSARSTVFEYSVSTVLRSTYYAYPSAASITMLSMPRCVLRKEDVHSIETTTPSTRSGRFACSALRHVHLREFSLLSIPSYHNRSFEPMSKTLELMN